MVKIIHCVIRTEFGICFFLFGCCLMSQKLSFFIYKTGGDLMPNSLCWCMDYMKTSGEAFNVMPVTELAIIVIIVIVIIIVIIISITFSN